MRVARSAGRRSRPVVPAGDRATVRIEALIVSGDAELVAPGQHLDRKWLVQLEEVDGVELQSGLFEHSTRRGHGAVAHQVRLDACVGVADESELRLEAELLRGV